MLKTTRPTFSFFSLPFVLTAIFAVSPMTRATEYYVATTGSDSNPGTLAAPWKSINKGVDRYNPGDTLYLRGGTYNLTSGIYFYRSGTAAAPITFRAYPGETVVLDGSSMATQVMLVDIECNYFVMQD